MEKQLESNKNIELTYQAASSFRKFSGAFFDWFVTIITTIILMIPALFIMQNNSGYKSLIKNMNSEQINSQLYVGDENSTTVLSTYLKNNDDLTYNEKSEKIDSALTYFYSTYIAKDLNDSYKKYEEFKLNAEKDGKKMFDSSLNRTLTNSDYDYSYFKLYCDHLDNVAINYLSLNSNFKNYSNKIALIYIFSFLGVIIISILIYFLIIPLCISRGKRTLGMLLTSVSLIGPDGLSCSYKRFLLRFLFFFFVEFIGSLVALLIPFAVSVTMSLVSKNKQGLKDYILNTYLVDTKGTIVYKNVDELNKKQSNNSNLSFRKDNFGIN